jgi:hypothetical protein
VISALRDTIVVVAVINDVTADDKDDGSSGDSSICHALLSPSFKRLLSTLAGALSAHAPAYAHAPVSLHNAVIHGGVSGSGASDITLHFHCGGDVRAVVSSILLLAHGDDDDNDEDDNTYE